MVIWKQRQEQQRVGCFVQVCCSGPHPLLLEEELEGLDSDGSDSDGSDSDGLESNGLDSNGLDSDGLDSDGLDSDGLDSDGLDSDGLDSEVVSLRPEDTLERGEHLLYVNLQLEEHL